MTPNPDSHPTGRRPRLWAGVAVAIVALVVLVAMTRPTPPDAAVVTGQAAGGELAPEVEMVDFDGEQVALTDYLGTPVILNFWASWCPFCIAEMPDFELANQAMGGRVVFLGVNLQDDPGLAARMADETGITYRLLRDPQGVVYAAFGGLAMPTTVFIDGSGTVSEVVSGQMSESQLLSKIEEHFSIGT